MVLRTSNGDQDKMICIDCFIFNKVNGSTGYTGNMDANCALLILNSSAIEEIHYEVWFNIAKSYAQATL